MQPATYYRACRTDRALYITGVLTPGMYYYIIGFRSSSSSLTLKHRLSLVYSSPYLKGSTLQYSFNIFICSRVVHL
jgi:hypothetical protein